MKVNILLVFTLVCCGITTKNFSQKLPGTIDSSFGIAGKAVTTFPRYQSSYIFGIAVQPDGKVVAVGDATNKRTGGYLFAIARYKYDGSLDSSFAFKGLTTDSIVHAASSEATGVALQKDGKIVVCGTVHNSNGHTVLAVVRYNTNGTLDKSFGTAGIDTTHVGYNSQAKAIAIDSDGNILVAGSTYSSLDGPPYIISNFALVRYKTDGNIDSSFGLQGIDTSGNFSAGHPGANAIALQSDGKIVIAGNYEDTMLSEPQWAIVRYNRNGGIDSSFGTNGMERTLIGSECFAEAAALQNDGKILVTGYSYNNQTGESIDAVRYLSNGNPDSSFGVNGITQTGIAPYTGEGTGSSQSFAIDQENNGKIILGGMGSEYVNNTGAFEMVRYNSTGSPDNTFGQKKDGEVITKFSGKIGDGASSVKISNSRIYLAGESAGNFAIAAYNNDEAGLPVVTSSPANTENLCPGTSVTLTSSSTTGNTWNTGATTQSITTDSAGSYFVTVNFATSAVKKITYAICVKPAGTRDSAITSNSAIVKWNGVPCHSGYTLQYRKTGTTAYTIFPLPYLSHKITGLLPSTTYEWRVRTVCIDSPIMAGAYTALSSFTTAAGLSDTYSETSINGISLYPNPAHSSVTVSFNSEDSYTSLQIINATGQSMMQNEIAAYKGKNTTQLNISVLAPGIYMLLIKNKSGVQTKKFVKE